MPSRSNSAAIKLLRGTGDIDSRLYYEGILRPERREKSGSELPGPSDQATTGRADRKPAVRVHAPVNPGHHLPKRVWRIGSVEVRAVARQALHEKVNALFGTMFPDGEGTLP